MLAAESASLPLHPPPAPETASLPLQTPSPKTDVARAARLQERRAEQERAAAVQDQWAERRTREAAERLAGGDADAAARLDGLAADCLAEAKRLRARAERLGGAGVSPDKARAQIKRFADLAVRHEAAAEKARAKGDSAKVAKHMEKAKAAQARSLAWKRRERMLAQNVAVAQTADKIVAGLMQATAAATAALPTMPNAKQQRDEEKRRRLLEAQEAKKRRDLAAADVVYDPRTAAGKREFDVQNLGARKRARVGLYDKLFRNKAEAKAERVLACSKFDELCHAAFSGLLPEPRFEPAVDSSKIPGFPEDRAAGLEQVAVLKAHIGEEPFALLFHRIHLGFSFSGMVEQGHGRDARALGVMFVAAVDAVARFWRLSPRSLMVEGMDKVLEERGIA